MVGWLWVVACDGPDPTVPPDGEADADTDADADSDADTDADSDADTDADTEIEPFTVTAPTTRLHDDIKSMAYVGWTQDGPGPVRVEYSVDPGEWLTTPEVEREAGTWEQIVLGIPFDTDADWRILAAGAVVAEGELHTGPLPYGLPTAELESEDPSRQLPEGRYLLTSVNQSSGGWFGGPFWTVILDRKGRTVWARRSEPWNLFVQVSASTGTELLIDLDTTWSDFDAGAGSRVLRTKLDREIEEIPTPGLQHAFVEHEDGTLAWTSIQHHYTEAVVELPPGATDVDIVWTCGDDWPEGSDCESNGLFWHPSTQTYLYSSWTNHSVVSFERATGQTLWWAGNVSGGYAFSPPSSSFWLQHGVSWTDAGTLLLSSEESGPTTVAREYAVDTVAETLTEVWTFDAQAYAVVNGDAWRLANGNTLHVVGSAGMIYEVAPDLSVVWHVDYHSDRLLGRGELLEDLYVLADP